jgi:DNA polymerase-3 subunit epsilon
MLAFDLETTGIDRFDDVPVSFALVAMRQGEVVDEFHSLVDPGREIPAGAAAVHGISRERAEAEGLPMEEAITAISVALLDASSRGVPVVGFNLQYDLTMTDARMRALGGGGLVDRGWHGPVLDPLVLDRKYDKYRKGKKTLDLVCGHYGVVNAAAHDAAGDAIAAAQVLVAMCASHPVISGYDLDELTRLQAGWHREWAVSFDEYLRTKGSQPMDQRDFDWPIAGVGGLVG